MRPSILTHKSLAQFSEELSKLDPVLGRSYVLYGKPPMWSREPGFATLLKIILEQQVSLASAQACFDKLCARVRLLTPESLLKSSDAELRKDGFSRQKTAYAKHLAEAILEQRIDLFKLKSLPDSEVKHELIKLKGVGEWTSDIYLLMALRRPDVMPKGDIALHTAWHKLSGEARPDSEEFLAIAERWQPYRSVAARMLWHFYLSERNDRRRKKKAPVQRAIVGSRP
jgi:DNA-3-methyladenine glycosylase II